MAIRGGGSRSGGGHIGGSRSGGGHFSSSSSSYRRTSSGGHTPSFHTIIHIGNNGVSSNNGSGQTHLPTLFSKIFGIVFIMIFIIAITSTFCSAKIGLLSDDISVIEQDYNYYYQIAQRATTNSSYKTTAVIVNIIKNPDGKKYCIAYEYNTISNSYEMTSFYVYTQQDLEDLNYRIGRVIDVATVSSNISSTTDSVPMDYLNTTLSDDEEYTSLFNQKIITIIVLVVLDGVFIGLMVLWIVKTVKKHKKQEQQIETKQEQTSKGNIKVCNYCGATYDKSISECEGCGSKNFTLK